MAKSKYIDDLDAVVLAVGEKTFNTFMESLTEGAESQATSYGQIFEGLAGDPDAADKLGLPGSIEGLNALGNFPFGDLGAAKSSKSGILYSVKFTRIPNKRTFVVKRKTVSKGIAALANAPGYEGKNIYPGLIFGSLTGAEMIDIHSLGIRFDLFTINPVTSGRSKTPAFNSNSGAGSQKIQHNADIAYLVDDNHGSYADSLNAPENKSEADNYPSNTYESLDTFKAGVMNGVFKEVPRRVIITFTDSVEEFERYYDSFQAGQEVDVPQAQVKKKQIEQFMLGIIGSMKSAADDNIRKKERGGKLGGSRSFPEAQEALLAGLTDQERCDNGMRVSALPELSAKTSGKNYTLVTMRKSPGGMKQVRATTAQKPASLDDYSKTVSVSELEKAKVTAHLLGVWVRIIEEMIASGPNFQTSPNVLSYSDYVSAVKSAGGRKPTQTQYRRVTQMVDDIIIDFQLRISLILEGFIATGNVDKKLIVDLKKGLSTAGQTKAVRSSFTDTLSGMLSPFKGVNEVFHISRRQLRILLERISNQDGAFDLNFEDLMQPMTDAETETDKLLNSVRKMIDYLRSGSLDFQKIQTMAHVAGNEFDISTGSDDINSIDSQTLKPPVDAMPQGEKVAYDNSLQSASEEEELYESIVRDLIRYSR